MPLDEELARWLDDVERLRDPSHQQSWPPSRWRAVISGARLAVEETQLFRKRHPIEPWLARAGCAADRAAQVREVFANAPEAARQAYLIDGESFTDTKMCLRAVKR